MRAYLLLLLVLAAPVFAQNSVTLTPSVTSGDGSITTSLTWSTNPPLTGASPCTASGHPSWTGPRAGSGGPVSITISTSGTLSLNLACTFPGDSLLQVSWTNPTTNTDGTPYSNPDIVRLKWTFNPTLTTNPQTAAAGEFHVDVSQPASMRTITGISQTGTARVSAFARNTLGVFSDPSNAATKVFTGNVTVTEMVSITVNPKPAAPTGVATQ
jgi:hypothetical protein